MTKKSAEFNIYDRAYTFECPHCDLPVQVLENDTACCIFRHAVYKTSMQQVGPHTSKDECDRLVSEELVFGCAKPFRLFKDSPAYVEECDYI
jgi:hypothetical protein